MQWSLEDIYKKQVRGNIPPRRHLRVLGENDQLALPMGGEGVEGAPVLKKHLLPGYEKGDVHVAEDPIDQLQAAGMLLGLGGAPKKGNKGDMSAVRNIIQYVEELLDRYGVEGKKERISILSNLYNYKMAEKLPIGERFNWVQFVKGHHKAATKGIIDEEFIDQLSRLSGSGSVNVGNPEFAGIVFLTDTEKAPVGDIVRDGVTYEVKAQNARMGDGHPSYVFQGLSKVLDKYNLPFERTGQGSNEAWETLLLSIQTIKDSELDNAEKKEAIIEAVYSSTPKKEIYDKAAKEFEQWANSNMRALEDPEELKKAYAALQILYYWAHDGKKFNYLWAANNKLDSYIFPIDDSTSFTDMYQIVNDYFNVTRVGSDSKYGAIGITLK